jgi:chlorophyllide a reductase subunit Y
VTCKLERAVVAWLEAHGAKVRFRASLEDDLAALDEYGPDVAIGTTPVVQAAKERAIPSLYFTNLISSRPLMGPAGAGSLAQVINAARNNRARFDEMRAFFDGVGTGHSAGVWSKVPVDRPAFREQHLTQISRLRRQQRDVSGGA